ncbi:MULTISPECIES: hypothetical protein [Serratia]|uniref:hypothetical protein n=1 Tax=Serratia TaxID=613 RepID=UPI0011131F07|nr:MULTISPECIES: hypothetical protein [Serratia]WLS21728.1 hypothetical protein RAA91_11455 [Serratia marcescens]HCB1443949.1 hypothetical protein [Serratia marcescens]HCB1481385.1 hypothetical protein [Serratia marcescens]HCB1611078.1 hypothetical protein [Serratia marcescens]HCB1615921.1 hypothetical protein [Serratia marcescens]
MDIQTNATNEGRVIALQVALAVLVDLWGRDNPENKAILLNLLERTGIDPINSNSSSAFHELIEMIRGLEEIRG